MRLILDGNIRAKLIAQGMNPNTVAGRAALVAELAADFPDLISWRYLLHDGSGRLVLQLPVKAITAALRLKYRTLADKIELTVEPDEVV